MRPLHSNDITEAGNDALALPTRTLPPRAGEKLGRYVLIEHIGAGGAGTVYAAYDSVLDRRVALKLLAGEARGPAVTMSDQPGWPRLVQEARMLAKLNHAHVVTVYDVGSVDDRAYIAMEFVEGIDLAGWIEMHRGPGATDRTGWREAAALMLQAGHGLAEAHARGIVHGDFKPANVLVESRPSGAWAKVTDFGIARAAERDANDTDDSTLASGEERNVRRVGAGTPRYMTPEQFMGATPSEATDAYAFACALYEALYGRPPHTARNVGDLVLVKADPPPPPPGDADAPAWAWPLLQRALAPDPGDRTTSLPTMLRALEGGLRPSRARLAVAGTLMAGAAIAALAMAGPTSSGTSLCVTEEDGLAGAWDDGRRDEVQSALLQTRHALAVDLWDRISPQLDDYADRWRDAHRRACESGDQLGSIGLSERAYACLRTRRTRLARLADALAEITPETAPRVLTATDRLVSAWPPEACLDPETLTASHPLPADRELADRYGAVRGALAHSDALFDLGLFASSLRAAEEARELVGDIDDPRLQAEVADGVGGGLRGMSRYAESRAEYERAYVLARETDADALAGHIALSLSRIMADGLEDHDAALFWVEVAGTEYDKLGRHLGVVLHRRANALASAGRYEEAREAYDRAIESLEDKGEPTFALAAAHNEYGNLLRQMAKFDEAIAQFELAREIDMELYGPNHPNTLSIDVGIGGTHFSQGNLEESERLHKRALERLSETLPPGHSLVRAARANLAVTYGKMGQLDKALPEFETLVEIAVSSHGEESMQAARMRNNLAVTLGHLGRMDEALREYERALGVQEKILGEDHADTAIARVNVAEVAREVGDLERSLALLFKAEKQVARLLPRDHPRRGIVAAELGGTLVDAERYEDAIPQLETAIVVLQGVKPDINRLAWSYARLSESLTALGRDPARADELADLAVQTRPDSESLKRWHAARTSP